MRVADAERVAGVERVADTERVVDTKIITDAERVDVPRGVDAPALDPVLLVTLRELIREMVLGARDVVPDMWSRYLRYWEFQSA